MAQPSIARRDFLTGMLLGVGTLVNAQTGRQPNIVLILTDDQGWWDLGLHGNKDIDTPVMDRWRPRAWSSRISTLRRCARRRGRR